jgi:peptide/nickel transport system substrate-binding protein
MNSSRHKLGLFDRLLGLIEHPRLSDRVFLRLLFFVVVASGLGYLLAINSSFIVSTPTRGGVISEGIVGIPRFVNPALAITRTDQDVAALVYSGLMKISPDGTLVPDLADKIVLSEDGTTYTVTLRKDRSFHDGTPVTGRDALFTIELMRDPDLKSPLRGNWSDVVLTEINEYEFTVTLSEPYAPFIENFTFGVMPSHIWKDLPIEQLPFSQYNTEPVGSGPFMISKVNRDASGLISGYELEPSPYSGDTPNLGGFELKFYQNESVLATAFSSGEISATIYLTPTSIANLDATKYRIITEPLPRVFGIFINQNRSAALRDLAARKALSAAIDRDEIINTVLGGYGVPITSPTTNPEPELVLENTEQSRGSSTGEIATAILEDGGWKKNDQGLWQKKIGQEIETLAVTIRTGNSELFESTANLVAEAWRSLGVEVQVEQYEQAGLVQSVIRSRDFETLLFGLDMNRQQDLYPFWHSSQKDDPGLNVAQYTNITVDQLLESARTTQDTTERKQIQTEAAHTIQAEVPAIFLFAPSITYVILNELTVADMQDIGKPADRFMNISEWHARTDTVWPIFQNK